MSLHCRYIIRSVDSSDKPLSISWPILGGVIAVWLLTLAIILKRITFVSQQTNANEICLALLIETIKLCR